MAALIPMAGTIAWLAAIVWQLRLAETKGKIWSRNGYVTRESNETVFEACMVFYWIALVWGAGMLIAMIIVAIKGISN